MNAIETIKVGTCVVDSEQAVEIYGVETHRRYGHVTEIVGPGKPGHQIVKVRWHEWSGHHQSYMRCTLLAEESTHMLRAAEEADLRH